MYAGDSFSNYSLATQAASGERRRWTSPVVAASGMRQWRSGSALAERETPRCVRPTPDRSQTVYNQQQRRLLDSAVRATRFEDDNDAADTASRQCVSARLQ